MDAGYGFYEIELWNHSGQQIADISPLCTGLSFTRARNDVETLVFTVDLFAFERYCSIDMGGIDPKVLLAPDVTEVRLKRNGDYQFGTEVKNLNFSFVAAMSGFPVAVSCVGYLNFFADRYITKTYTSNERVAIAVDLINTTQAQTNGSFGVTISGTQYNTGFTDSERTYTQSNIKSSLQNLANISDYPFDFDFRYDKVFRTYQSIGALRDDIPTLIWGGPLSNVTGFQMDRSATSLYNKITGVGSGFGDATLISTAGDLTSQLNYYLREEIAQFNSVVVQDTLDRNTATELSVRKDLLQLPKITMTRDDLGGKWLNPGDRIQFQVNDHPWLSDVHGTYRAEQLDVTADQNQYETVTATLDNYGLVA